MTRYSKERKLKRRSRSNPVAVQGLVDLLRDDCIKDLTDQALTVRSTETTFRCGAKNCT